MTREKERFEIIERLKKVIAELESPEVDESFGVCLIVVKSRPAAESGFFSDIFGKYYTEMDYWPSLPDPKPEELSDIREFLGYKSETARRVRRLMGLA